MLGAARVNPAELRSWLTPIHLLLKTNMETTKNVFRLLFMAFLVLAVLILYLLPVLGDKL
jgi:hypothetical protein